MTRVAAIDLGTNTTRLLVADVKDDRVDEVDRRGVVTRLGEGVDESRAPAARGDRSVCSRSSRTSGSWRALSAPSGSSRSRRARFATPRTAPSSSPQVQHRFGFATRVVSGDEEAALTRRGVGALDATDARPRRRRRLDRARPRRHAHEPRHRLGATHRAPAPERPAHSRRARRREPATFALCSPSSSRRPRSASPAQSRSSTRCSAGSRSEAIDAEIELLAALTLAERRHVHDLDPDRAPTIVAGRADRRRGAPPLRPAGDHVQRARPARRDRVGGWPLGTE